MSQRVSMSHLMTSWSGGVHNGRCLNGPATLRDIEGRLLLLFLHMPLGDSLLRLPGMEYGGPKGTSK